MTTDLKQAAQMALEAWDERVKAKAAGRQEMFRLNEEAKKPGGISFSFPNEHSLRVDAATQALLTAIAALRSALQHQQAGEPVAWYCQHVMTESQGVVESWLTLDKDEEPGLKTAPGTSFVVRTPLYASPPATLPGNATEGSGGGVALDPTKPQHCRLGAPVPGFPTQECNCTPGACRLGKDDPAAGVVVPAEGQPNA